MSRHAWLLAIAVIVLAIAYPQVGYCQSGHHRGHSAAQHSNGKLQTEKEPTLPVATQNDIKRIADALNAANQKAPSETDKQSADAEKSVADWTPAIFVIAVFEMLITLAGVILVYRTLKYSRDLFEDQRVATNAAQDQAEIARAQAMAQITIKSAKLAIIAPWGCPYVEMVVSNTGQTVARNFVFNPTIKLVVPGKPIFRRGFLENWKENAGIDVPASAEIASNSTIAMHISVVKFLEQPPDAPPSRTIFVQMEIAYAFTDAFKRPQNGATYFYGVFRRNDVSDNDLINNQWDGDLTVLPKPIDWDSQD